MSIYKKILKIRQSLPDFNKDREVDGIKIISDEQMNQAIVPLLNKEGIITIPHGHIKDDKFELEMEFIDTEDESRCISHMSWPIDKRTYEFGATATLTEKYLYKMLLKIHTGEEGGNALSPDKVRDKAFGDTPLKSEITPGVENIPLSLLGITQPYMADGIQHDKVIDPITTLIAEVNTDQNIPQLEIKPEEKKAPEPSETLMNKINEGDWKIKVELKNCLSEVTLVKTLDKLYMNLGAAIYGHADNALCPINPYEVINKLPRRSKLKIRRPIIQYRVFGDEAFWKQLCFETGLKTREEIEALIALPKEEKKEEGVKPVIHELKLDFEIPEHMGADRDEEICFRLLANLRKFGVNQFAILYGLKNMTNKPEIDMTGGDDDVVLRFLSKASKLQIIEMIKLAKSAG